MPGEHRAARGTGGFEHDLVLALAEAQSADDASTRVLDVLVERGGWALAVLWLVDDDLLRFSALRSAEATPADDFTRVTSRLTFSRGVGVPGRAWETDTALWIDDVADEENFPRHAAAHEAGLHAGAAAPVADTRETIGVLEVYAPTSLPSDDERLAALSRAGRQLGQYLSRLSTEERLRESEERTGQITAAALDCIITMDHDGRVTDVNPAAEATFGFTREQAIGSELADLIIPPELRDAHRAALARYLTSGTATILDRRLELTGQRVDGSQMPVELTVTRLGRRDPPAFAGFIRDISERRREEAQRTELLERERSARLRAEQAERQAREIADVLQRSLLPPRLPEISGVELGAAYRPGVEGVQVGGDFYDVFELPGDEWGLMIGDVRGKGPEAASVTSLIRHSVRAAAIRTPSPADVLRAVNDVMLSGGSQEELCTVIYGRCAPGVPATLRLSIGGHPQPVLLRADGDVAVVGTPGTLLGVEQDPKLSDSEIVLSPGDALVMVTDGVQDSRTRDGRLGEHRLLELVRDCRGFDAAAIARRIEQAVATTAVGGSQDDVAVLVVRAAAR